MDGLLECVLFIAGLAFGSFLNVCISRIPRDQSIVVPHPIAGLRRSHHWCDNIPLLVGLCCAAAAAIAASRISLRHPAVEF